MPLFPLSESLGAQTGVFQEGTDDRQLGLFGLGGGTKTHEIVTTWNLHTLSLYKFLGLC